MSMRTRGQRLPERESASQRLNLLEADAFGDLKRLPFPCRTIITGFAIGIYQTQQVVVIHKTTSKAIIVKIASNATS